MSIKILYEKLLEPTQSLIESIARLDGDIVILGVGGKMGPSLAKLAKRAVDIAGVQKNIIGVARFSEPGLKDELEQEGITTFTADLLNDSDLQRLPNARNVLYLAGTKFGTTGKESFTWAMNTYLPGRVAEKYKESRIVVFSTGNVYPLVSTESSGANEEQAPLPLGEYAQSCLGRERVFQYFSQQHQTPILIYRLNYANDVTYGVLSDIALAVKNQHPIDLRMGYVNIIWQQDANEIALRSLNHCSVPSKILNVTGTKKLSVRQLAAEFGKIFNREPVFINSEQETALLSDASESRRLFGEPPVSVHQMIEVIAGWINEGGRLLNKPTHFQEREGKF
ncbi:NAD-dependent epimerase/dehydratase family protein [Chryseolinea sp. T2]|uniref:NAD-dependent epimerase/dehydratase family protein n=1 Tax=Chryseolinea sp. T2 TaxID=3129255 RepID=UPI003076FC3C